MLDPGLVPRTPLPPLPRLVLAHEGGYSEIYVPFCGVKVLEELSGVDSGARGLRGRRGRKALHPVLSTAAGVVDPFIADVGSAQWQPLQPHQETAIAAAAKNLGIALLPQPAALP